MCLGRMLIAGDDVDGVVVQYWYDSKRGQGADLGDFQVVSR
jgi:hypothetical protein